MEKFERHGNFGFFESSSGVVAFDIQGAEMRDHIAEKEYRNLYSQFLNDNMTMQIEGYTVPIWGDGHNLYPQEVYDTLSDNKLLPEILQKQVEFLFGKGPFLYRNEIVGSGKDVRTYRVPVDDPKSERWLDSWEKHGHDNYWD